MNRHDSSFRLSAAARALLLGGALLLGTATPMAGQETIQTDAVGVVTISRGSTAVITGDVTQVDLPGGARSGLRHAEHVLRKVDGIDFVYFSHADVVRHPLVQRIVQAYERNESGGSGGDI